ncbi:MAG TPA: hypothetical protein VH143_20965 [Kofleriaceae bacterium]|jgi:nucleoside phosphorylase|nr:hypothetical protein [Kofleriaceae bacterium]
MTSTLADKIERAFDYRGFVTVARTDGPQVVGFLFDRTADYVELYDEQAAHKVRLAVGEIADVVLSGDDAAAKAQKIWERRYPAIAPRQAGDAPTAAEERVRHPVLILVAMPIELRAVARAIGADPPRARATTIFGRLGSSPVVATAIGIGGGAAREIALEQPRLVISCGFSGALDPDLAAGDVIVASSVRDESGDVEPVADSILRIARRAIHGHAHEVEGELLCTTTVAATSDEKRSLARPGRLAVDLESWTVAHAARQAGVPWLAVRAIVDPLAVDLPAFVREPHASFTGAALRYALGGRRQIVELAQLAWRARKASHGLESALHALARALDRLIKPEPHG